MSTHVGSEKADPTRDVDWPDLRGAAVAILAIVAGEATSSGTVRVIAPRSQEQVGREVGNQERAKHASEHVCLGPLAILELTAWWDQVEEPGPLRPLAQRGQVGGMT